MFECLTEFDELIDTASSKLSSNEFNEFCRRVVEALIEDYDVEV